MTDKPDEEIMQALWPGSSTFQPHILCPCCGWHFKRGMTDPTGEVVAMKPGCMVVCGQCLHVLLCNEALQFEAQTQAELDALPEDIRKTVFGMWQMAFIALTLMGPEPNGPAQ